MGNKSSKRPSTTIPPSLLPVYTHLVPAMPCVKKGLLIGINYAGSSCALSGCINDTYNLKDFLIQNKYFSEPELVFMNDNSQGDQYPTRVNIMNQLKSLVNFAKEHDKEQVLLFFSYSGHGSQVKDYTGEEEDGQDEVLCPIDYDNGGFIVDDDLRSTVIDKMGSNVTLVILIDACHSGTMVDLKYMYTCDKTSSCLKLSKYKDTKCNVVMISGCRDNQTSDDAFIPDRITKKKEYQGAMTAAFLANYKDEITTTMLISGMRKWLKDNDHQQVPQLSSGKLFDVSKSFLLSVYND